jgi:hypothetical protein
MHEMGHNGSRGRHESVAPEILEERTEVKISPPKITENWRLARGLLFSNICFGKSPAKGCNARVNQIKGCKPGRTSYSIFHIGLPFTPSTAADREGTFGLAAAPVLGGTCLVAGILLGLVEYRCEPWATAINIDAHWWPCLLIAAPLLCMLWARTWGCWEPHTGRR